MEMECFREVPLVKLSLSAVSYLLPGEQQLVLRDGAIGLLPPSTFLVLSIRDHYAIKRDPTLDYPMKRLLVSEVLPEGEIGMTAVTLIGPYAVEAETYFRKQSQSQKKWLVLRSAKLNKRTGPLTSGWCHFSPSLGPKKSESLELILFEKTSSVHNIDIQASVCVVPPTFHRKNVRYTKINSLEEGMKSNVFCVVSALLVDGTTMQGNLHKMVAVVDPSCADDSATMKDLAIQIFASNNKEVQEVLKHVVKGSILRLTGVLMESYEGRKRGKIFSESQLVVFDGDEENCIPHSVGKSAWLTDEEKERVASLREWAKIYIPDSADAASIDSEQGKLADVTPSVSTVNQNSGKGVSAAPEELFLSDIKGEHQRFNLKCQIINTCRVEINGGEAFLIRIQDGTKTTINFMDFEELLEKCEFDSPQAETVDVVVKNVELSSQVELMDCVCLKHVACVPVETCAGGNIIYGLIMKEDSSHIERMGSSSEEVKELQRKLSNYRESNIRLKNIQSPPLSLVSSPKSRNSTNIQPLLRENSASSSLGSRSSIQSLHKPDESVETRAVKLEQISPRQEQLLRPDVWMQDSVPEHLQTSKDLSAEGPCIQQAQSCDVREECHPSPYGGELVVDESKGEDNEDSNFGLMKSNCDPSDNSESDMSDDINDKECEEMELSVLSKSNYTSKSSRKRTSTAEGAEGECQATLPKTIKRVHTEIIDLVRVSSISNMKFKKPDEEIYVVLAVVTQLGSLNDHPCSAEECKNGFCYGNFLSGHCIKCKTDFRGWELKEHYTPEELASKHLNCFLCSKISHLSLSEKRNQEENSELSQQVTRSQKNEMNEDDTGSTGSILPYLSLWMVLKDPKDGAESTVYVSGDDAVVLLDIHPKFAWIKEHEAGNLGEFGEKLTLLLEDKTPLWFGIEVLYGSRGNIHYNIRNTKLTVK